MGEDVLTSLLAKYFSFSLKLPDQHLAFQMTAIRGIL